MAIPICVVDAFTDEPFRGNPAAVCIMPAWREDSWLQSVASEMNLSETAYLVERDDGAFDLRWFTPTTEVDLCGHATLASAHVLFEREPLDTNESFRFFTRSGWLTASVGPDGVVLDLPSTPLVSAEPSAGLMAALGIETAPRFAGDGWHLVVLGDERAVRDVNPDFAALATLEGSALIVTARADDPAVDFVSRCFVPWLGIDEDPVTGSAHCCLTPYWASVLGRTEMVAYQASSRGGILRVRLEGDRVHLAGKALTVWTGQLLV